MPVTLAGIHQALTSHLSNQELLLDEQTTGVVGLDDELEAAFGTRRCWCTGARPVSPVRP